MNAPRKPASPCKGEVGREADGRGSQSRFSRTAHMTKRARRLRSNTTDAEARIWRALRRNQIKNAGFRRQHPMGPFILDFYCPSLRLGIEIDGGQHSFDENRLSDERRSQWFSERGILIVRFWNNDVLANTVGVLSAIARVVDERIRAQTPTPTLPLSGGGRRAVR